MESSYLTDIGADNGQGGMHLGLADVGGGFNNNYNGALDELYIYGSALDDSDMSFVMDGATWNPRARDPQPADGIILSGTSVNLAWSAGWADTALGEHLAPDSHTVYLSQNLDAVLEGRAEATLDSTTETTLAVADLEIDTVYYWRVDEVNDTDTDSPWTGQVWSFQVPALAAKDPVPVDGAQFQALTTTLRWTSGIGAKSHVVYMGRTYDEVADATSGGVAVTEPAYTPQGL
jgi:hypothetical protein